MAWELKPFKRKVQCSLQELMVTKQKVHSQKPWADISLNALTLCIPARQLKVFLPLLTDIIFIDYKIGIIIWMFYFFQQMIYCHIASYGDIIQETYWNQQLFLIISPIHKGLQDQSLHGLLLDWTIATYHYLSLKLLVSAIFLTSYTNMVSIEVTCRIVLAFLFRIPILQQLFCVMRIVAPC